MYSLFIQVARGSPDNYSNKFCFALTEGISISTAISILLSFIVIFESLIKLHDCRSVLLSMWPIIEI